MKNLFLWLCLLPFCALAQKMPDYGTNKVRIAETDKLIVADIQPVTSVSDIQSDRLYYWYAANSIHATQGGFSGHLLNGQYNEYYLNKSLKEQGPFKNGLKDGTWKNWNDNGTLIQILNWKEGLKSGIFSQFDELGNLKQSGMYANNLLNGPVKTYHGKDFVEVVTYHQGHIVPNKSSSSFWKKINIFKKDRQK